MFTARHEQNVQKKIQFNAEARVRYQTRLFVVDKRALGQAFRE